MVNKNACISMMDVNKLEACLLLVLLVAWIAGATP